MTAGIDSTLDLELEVVSLRLNTTIDVVNVNSAAELIPITSV